MGRSNFESISTDEPVYTADPDEDLVDEFDRLDGDGVTIDLKSNATYVASEDGLYFDNAVTVRGPGSATLQLKDGAVSGDSTTPFIGINAPGTEFYGFDINNGDQADGGTNPDRYCVKFAPEATHCKMSHVDIYNAAGDAWGNVTNGTQISHTHCEDFSEEAFDVRADAADGEPPALISHFTVRGIDPIQIRTDSSYADSAVGNVKFEHGYVYGTDGSAVNFRSNDDTLGIKNVTFSDVTINSLSTAFSLGDEIDIDGIVLRDVDLHSRNWRGLYSTGDPTISNFRMFGGSITKDNSGPEAIDLENITDATFVDVDVDYANEELVLDGNSGPVEDVHFRIPGMSYSDLTLDNAGSIARVTVNDEGDNGTDDPRSGGPWQGEGYSNLTVTWEDTAAGNIVTELYSAGDWTEIGARSSS